MNCNNSNSLSKFDTNKWISGNQKERGNMASDLVDNKETILIGKTKSEIYKILGKPKDTTNLNFHYLVDFGYLTPFHLDIYFDKEKLIVNEVTLAD